MLINSGTYANQTPQIESRRRKTHANHWIFNLQGIFYFCILVQYSLILAQYLTPAKCRRDGGWRLHSTLGVFKHLLSQCCIYYIWESWILEALLKGSDGQLHIRVLKVRHEQNAKFCLLKCKNIFSTPLFIMWFFWIMLKFSRNLFSLIYCFLDYRWRFEGW